MTRKNVTSKTDIVEVSEGGRISELLHGSTRRQFLKVAGIGGLGTLALYLIGCGASEEDVAQEKRQVYAANATGLVVSDPTRCVGCRRCELACTEYKDGFSQPSMARLNVRRNWGFGPRGVQLGYFRGEGRFGNHRVIQDTCKQCPHPVPCQMACPNDAIEVVPPVNARVINQDKCQGCHTCERACPWGMPTYNTETGKAQKCDLCAGNPECVQACPAGALQYIPWQDLTKTIPQRYSVPAYIGAPAAVTEACQDCHSTGTN